MNTELLKKVAAKLRRMRHKEHFAMPGFAKKTPCGTAACIGGHGLISEGYKPIFQENERWSGEFRSPKGKKVQPWAAARQLFGLTPRQAHLLFEKEMWPDEFGPWVWDDDPKVAADRIDHFVATKGKE